eukprot:TRINITY_DN8637_c0_g1_i2.p2 TRINITY_DN8637_c0_g1~~TRINITY_DN8637_c0_g1_i2.p2  ORF type:complete len:149 (-),score=30.96 TRINITY_DN8637_c0_g1_i2:141-587(-)
MIHLLTHRLQPGTTSYQAIVEKFGPSVVASDGVIDRKALGAVVFGNETAMKQLTDIVWPAIRESAKTELQQASETSSAKVAVLEAAVLLEAGWTDLVDEVWVLSVPREVAIQRLHERNGLSEEEGRIGVVLCALSLTVTQLCGGSTRR